MFGAAMPDAGWDCVAWLALIRVDVIEWEEGGVTGAAGFGAWKTSFEEVEMGSDRAAKWMGEVLLQCIQSRVLAHARGSYRGSCEARNPNSATRQGEVSRGWSGE